MMTTIESLVEEVELNIFSYNIKTALDLLPKITEEISIKLKEMDQEKIRVLNEALNLLNIAIKNKDYMLYSDILKYEVLNLMLMADDQEVRYYE